MFCKMIIYYSIHPNDTLWTIAQKYQTTIQDIQKFNPHVDFSLLQLGQVIRICPLTSSYISLRALSLMNTMRLLWEQHGAWTRMAITSMVFGLPDESLVVERLLRNPQDFVDALRPFYGEVYAKQFGNLLTDHLVIAADLVKASKAGNNEKAENAEIRWYQNALDIALLLSRLNPFFSYEEWRLMLFEHLALVKTEAVDMLTKEYAKGIETYDKIEIQALGMADMMSSGIMKQFQIS
jgi:hypothetical protein